MRYPFLKPAAILVCCAPLLAQSGPPYSGETLTYSVNWPSGLPVGEARFEAKRIPDQAGALNRWELLFTLQASVPGFEVADKYRSVVTAAFCSVEFEKDSKHGKKIARERTTFDPRTNTAVRQTLGGGGTSTIETAFCPRDALAFFYHVRRELAAGRVPPAQTMYLGGAYQIRFEYAGRQRIRAGDEMYDAERLTTSVKGKASDINFEIFFAQESDRRPVFMRVPLPAGSFVLELVP
jgi:hypothetical protein